MPEWQRPVEEKLPGNKVDIRDKSRLKWVIRLSVTVPSKIETGTIRYRRTPGLALKAHIIRAQIASHAFLWVQVHVESKSIASTRLLANFEISSAPDAP